MKEINYTKGDTSMLYVVKTHTTFENVQIVEATSQEEAELFVMSGESNDFLQIHLDEHVVEVTTTKSVAATVNTLKAQGYF